MRTLLLAGLLLLAPSARAEVGLAPLFSDGMVLQRDRPVPVWGRADPRERVRIRLLDASVETRADAQGHWRATMGPFGAAVDATLVVEGANRIEVGGVCVGEVWLCSGQSNMEWPVRAAAEGAKAIASSADAGLRLFTVAHRVAAEPVAQPEGRWVRCGPDTVGTFSAVGYFFGREVRTETDVPVGLIQATWGGTPAEAWTSIEALSSQPVLAPILARGEEALRRWPQAERRHREALERWRRDVARARSEGRPEPRAPRPPMGPEHPHFRAGLYNGMIAPLVPYAIRGVIWYQGESNAGRAVQYETLFPTLIRDWRARWGAGDFPFLFVQVANFRAVRDEPADSDWAELREAQRLALREPGTGMAVATDIGEAGDIHPRNKQEVGRRLALWARRLAYGRDDAVASGPLYAASERSGSRIILHFTSVGGGLRCRGGEELRGFAIAGRTRRWRWAKARIVGDRVEVWHPQMRAPVAVRYAWADNPDANLENAEGLPASPFRTDDWPLSTAGNG